MTTMTESKNDTGSESCREFSKKCSSIMNDTVSIAILILVTVFPLIFHNSYYDILETKYQCYRFCILLLLAAIPFLVLGMVYIDLKKFEGQNTNDFLLRLHPRNWKKTFCAADAAVLAFWLATGISTLQSDYLHEAFWGDQGRFSGFLLLTLYVASYIIISHFWKFNGNFLELFLAVSMLLCLFGITDYFRMDIMHFRKTSDAVIAMASYTSTIGNINTYTAYVGIVIGLSSAMFALEKKPLKQLWYYLCLVISFTAILMGRSDNAYLSIAAVFVFLPFILFTNREGIKKYLIITATFFTIIQFIAIINKLYPSIIIGTDSLFTIIAGFCQTLRLAPLLWILVIMFWIYDRKLGKNTSFSVGKNITLVHIWGVLILLLILAVCVVFFDANIRGNAERYGSFGQYLLFNDRWGTSRGYIWSKSLWMYKRLPLLHKLFGCGPDTYGCLVNKTIVFDVYNVFGNTTLDNAHNSFLQYLVTIGLAGLITYLTFLGTSFWHLMKNRKKNPYIPAILLAVICYVFQSSINLDVPIVTPFMWLLLAMGIAACKEKTYAP